MLLLTTMLMTSIQADGRKLSPMLTQMRMPQEPDLSPDHVHSERTGKSYLPLIIKLHDADVTLPESVSIIHRRGVFLLAYVPVDEIQAVSQLGVISRIEGGQVCTPVLNEARRFTFYPEVEQAVGLPEVYTGKGVVTGFTDIGFDPNHAAFRDPTTGERRVKLLTDYGLSPGSCTRLDTPAEIADWSTDDADQWHGTHVAGIMAGGYKDNPYWGIATESEIVGTTSVLYDALLLAGMEDVVGYAREVDKPAVINMSVCASLGPHDGTSLFCQYLDELAKEAVICISTGNYGEKVGYWGGALPQSGQSAGGFIDYYTWRPDKASGYLDIWSADATPLNFDMLVLDLDTDEVVARVPFPEITSGHTDVNFAIASSQQLLVAAGADESNGVVSAELARYLDGIVIISTEINPENNRFNALYSLSVKNLPEANGELAWRYIIGIDIKGDPGQRFSAYCSDQIRLRHVPDNDRAVPMTSDGVMNDFVTAHNVLGVGAMCSRNHWPLIDGQEGTSKYTVGDVAPFSSYWSSAPVRPLPDITAPGATLISSMSTPYIEAHPDRVAAMTLMQTAYDRDNYWCNASGTSMSSPYVAGVCALAWQADPDATPAEIVDAVISTAMTPQGDPANPRWGVGMLDSYAVIRKIIDNSGVGNIKADQTGDLGLPSLPVPLTAEALAAYAIDNRLQIATPQGRTVSPGSLSSGIYILYRGDAAIKVAL